MTITTAVCMAVGRGAVGEMAHGKSPRTFASLPPSRPASSSNSSLIRMLLQPFGSKRKASNRDDAITNIHTFEHCIEAVSLRPNLHWSHRKFIRLIRRHENKLLVAYCLYCILGNHRHRLFYSPKRRKADVHIHSNPEELSWIRQFNPHLRRA